LVAALGRDAPIDLAQALKEGRVLAPIDHPDPAHLHLSGVGLSHFGSPQDVAAMRAAAAAGDISDVVRMFLLGLEGGRPATGAVGAQPEWFYKGDGDGLVGPGAPLVSPDFALDGGEEPELAGIYTIAADGTPFRLGFTLANEFSDHVLERSNYLYLAHSKLRPASLGPELWVGELPSDIRGIARITRNGTAIWSKPFLTGEANMSHHLRNLEHHHFKYALFRRPDDLHVHFFGTATLSFTDGVKAQDGDIFEIEAPPFSLPLRNPLQTVRAPATGVRTL